MYAITGNTASPPPVWFVTENATGALSTGWLPVAELVRTDAVNVAVCSISPTLIGTIYVFDCSVMYAASPVGAETTTCMESLYESRLAGSAS